MDLHVPWLMSKLAMLVGELRGDQVGDDVECAGQLRIRAGDEAQGFPRFLGAELFQQAHPQYTW